MKSQRAGLMQPSQKNPGLPFIAALRVGIKLV